jgi:hypothetical protein
VRLRPVKNFQTLLLLILVFFTSSLPTHPGTHMARKVHFSHFPHQETKEQRTLN